MEDEYIVKKMKIDQQIVTLFKQRLELDLIELKKDYEGNLTFSRDKFEERENRILRIITKIDNYEDLELDNIIEHL